MLRQKSSEIRAVIVRWTHVKTKNVPTTSTQFLLVEHDAGLEPKGIANKYCGQKSEKAIVLCYQNSIVLVT